MKSLALLFLIPVLMLTACETTYVEGRHSSRRHYVRGSHYDDRGSYYDDGPRYHDRRHYGGTRYRSTYRSGYYNDSPGYRRSYSSSRRGYYHRPDTRVRVGVGF